MASTAHFNSIYLLAELESETFEAYAKEVESQKNMQQSVDRIAKVIDILTASLQPSGSTW